jgi:hypothetical protein
MCLAAVLAGGATLSLSPADSALGREETGSDRPEATPRSKQEPDIAADVRQVEALYKDLWTTAELKSRIEQSLERVTNRHTADNLKQVLTKAMGGDREAAALPAFVAGTRNQIAVASRQETALKAYNNALYGVQTGSQKDWNRDTELRWILLTRALGRLRLRLPYLLRDLRPVQENAKGPAAQVWRAASGAFEDLYISGVILRWQARRKYLNGEDQELLERWESQADEFGEKLLQLRFLLDETERLYRRQDPLLEKMEEWLVEDSQLIHDPKSVELRPLPSELLPEGLQPPTFPLRDLRQLVPWPYALGEFLGLGTLRAWYEHMGFELVPGDPADPWVVPRIVVSVVFVLNRNPEAKTVLPGSPKTEEPQKPTVEEVRLPVVTREFRGAPIRLEGITVGESGPDILKKMTADLGRNATAFEVLGSYWRPPGNPYYLDDEWFLPEDIAPGAHACAGLGGTWWPLSVFAGCPTRFRNAQDVAAISQLIRSAVDESLLKLRRRLEVDLQNPKNPLGECYVATRQAAATLGESQRKAAARLPSKSEREAPLAARVASKEFVDELIPRYLHAHFYEVRIYHHAMLPTELAAGAPIHVHPYPDNAMPRDDGGSWLEDVMRLKNEPEEFFERQITQRGATFPEVVQFLGTWRDLEEWSAELFGDETVAQWQVTLQNKKAGNRTFGGRNSEAYVVGAVRFHKRGLNPGKFPPNPRFPGLDADLAEIRATLASNTDTLWELRLVAAELLWLESTLSGPDVSAHVASMAAATSTDNPFALSCVPIQLTPAPVISSRREELEKLLRQRTTRAIDEVASTSPRLAGWTGDKSPAAEALDGTPEGNMWHTKKRELKDLSTKHSILLEQLRRIRLVSIRHSLQALPLLAPQVGVLPGTWPAATFLRVLLRGQGAAFAGLRPSTVDLWERLWARYPKSATWVGNPRVDKARPDTEHWKQSEERFAALAWFAVQSWDSLSPGAEARARRHRLFAQQQESGSRADCTSGFLAAQLERSLRSPTSREPLGRGWFFGIDEWEDLSILLELSRGK